MSGASAKRELGTGDKPTTSHGKATSEESRNKHKEESVDSIKSHRKGDKKKNITTSLEIIFSSLFSV